MVNTSSLELEVVALLELEASVDELDAEKGTMTVGTTVVVKTTSEPG